MFEPRDDEMAAAEIQPTKNQRASTVHDRTKKKNE
jgi:hypothetical protein